MKGIPREIYKSIAGGSRWSVKESKESLDKFPQQPLKEFLNELLEKFLKKFLKNSLTEFPKSSLAGGIRANLRRS